VDIVVPLYNEERTAHLFHLELARVTAALPFRVSIYYVDDGSTDGTAAVLESIAAADGSSSWSSTATSGIRRRSAPGSIPPRATW